MKKIAIIGAPGSGKTTLANGLFYYLKINSKHVELVPELIKYKVYKGVDFLQKGFDIVNTNEQKEFEDIFNSTIAQNQIDYLICDAPLCNGYFYASYYNKKNETPILKDIALENINNYDIIVFVKKIKNADYVTFGRLESEEQSDELEDHIEAKIKELQYSKEIFIVNQLTEMEIILKKII